MQFFKLVEWERKREKRVEVNWHTFMPEIMGELLRSEENNTERKKICRYFKIVLGEVALKKHGGGIFLLRYAESNDLPNLSNLLNLQQFLRFRILNFSLLKIQPPFVSRFESPLSTVLNFISI